MWCHCNEIRTILTAAHIHDCCHIRSSWTMHEHACCVSLWSIGISRDEAHVPTCSQIKIAIFLVNCQVCNAEEMTFFYDQSTLQCRHNESDGDSNHQPHNCVLNRLFSCRSKKTSKLLATGLCGGNSLVTSEFPAQRDSNAENVSIWWRHLDVHDTELNEKPGFYREIECFKDIVNTFVIL